MSQRCTFSLLFLLAVIATGHTKLFHWLQKSADSASYNDTETYIITKATFRCVFSELNETLLDQRFRGLKETKWTPVNKIEAAIFLAHVSHETDGLRTLVEYCQATNCMFFHSPNY